MTIIICFTTSAVFSYIGFSYISSVQKVNDFSHGILFGSCIIIYEVCSSIVEFVQKLMLFTWHPTCTLFAHALFLSKLGFFSPTQPISSPNQSFDTNICSTSAFNSRIHKYIFLSCRVLL